MKNKVFIIHTQRYEGERIEYVDYERIAATREDAVLGWLEDRFNIKDVSFTICNNGAVIFLDVDADLRFENETTLIADFSILHNIMQVTGPFEYATCPECNGEGRIPVDSEVLSGKSRGCGK